MDGTQRAWRYVANARLRPHPSSWECFNGHGGDPIPPAVTSSPGDSGIRPVIRRTTSKGNRSVLRDDGGRAFRKDECHPFNTETLPRRDMTSCRWYQINAPSRNIAIFGAFSPRRAKKKTKVTPWLKTCFSECEEGHRGVASILLGGASSFNAAVSLSGPGRGVRRRHGGSTWGGYMAACGLTARRSCWAASPPAAPGAGPCCCTPPSCRRSSSAPRRSCSRPTPRRRRPAARPPTTTARAGPCPRPRRRPPSGTARARLRGSRGRTPGCRQRLRRPVLLHASQASPGSSFVRRGAPSELARPGGRSLPAPRLNTPRGASRTPRRSRPVPPADLRSFRTELGQTFPGDRRERERGKEVRQAAPSPRWTRGRADRRSRTAWRALSAPRTLREKFCSRAEESLLSRCCPGIHRRHAGLCSRRFRSAFHNKSQRGTITMVSAVKTAAAVSVNTKTTFCTFCTETRVPKSGTKPRACQLKRSKALLQNKARSTLSPKYLLPLWQQSVFPVVIG